MPIIKSVPAEIVPNSMIIPAALVEGTTYSAPGTHMSAYPALELIPTSIKITPAVPAAVELDPATHKDTASSSSKGLGVTALQVPAVDCLLRRIENWLSVATIPSGPTVHLKI